MEPVWSTETTVGRPEPVAQNPKLVALPGAIVPLLLDGVAVSRPLVTGLDAFHKFTTVEPFNARLTVQFVVGVFPVLAMTTPAQ